MGPDPVDRTAPDAFPTATVRQASTPPTNLNNSWKSNLLHEHKKITLEEAHARKVATVLGLPLDQARALARGAPPHGGQQLNRSSEH
jgi:hypothetical protein